MSRLPLALACAGLLGACTTTTSTGTGASVTPRASDDSPLSYPAEYDQLKARCASRSGFLEPTGAPGAGRAATDYVCRLPTGASDAFERQ